MIDQVSTKWEETLCLNSTMRILFMVHRVDFQNFVEELGEPRFPEPLGMERARDVMVGGGVVGAKRNLGIFWREDQE